MGLITLPSATPGTDRSDLPKGSFVVDYRAKLGAMLTSFRAYVPDEPPHGRRSPYIVYAVTTDDQPKPEAYVVGSRIVGLETASLPEEACLVGTWFECRLDADTPVHVAGFRENLGGKFTTWSYGPFGSLVEMPLGDGRIWGDLDVVFFEIYAGVAAGPPFKAYVDDITVRSKPPETPY